MCKTTAGVQVNLIADRKLRLGAGDCARWQGAAKAAQCRGGAQGRQFSLHLIVKRHHAGKARHDREHIGPQQRIDRAATAGDEGSSQKIAAAGGIDQRTLAQVDTWAAQPDGGIELCQGRAAAGAAQEGIDDLTAVLGQAIGHQGIAARHRQFGAIAEHKRLAGIDLDDAEGCALNPVELDGIGAQAELAKTRHRRRRRGRGAVGLGPRGGERRIGASNCHGIGRAGHRIDLLSDQIDPAAGIEPADCIVGRAAIGIGLVQPAQAQITVACQSGLTDALQHQVADQIERQGTRDIEPAGAAAGALCLAQRLGQRKSIGPAELGIGRTHRECLARLGADDRRIQGDLSVRAQRGVDRRIQLVTCAEFEGVGIKRLEGRLRHPGLEDFLAGHRTGIERKVDIAAGTQACRHGIRVGHDAQALYTRRPRADVRVGRTRRRVARLRNGDRAGCGT